MSTLLTVVGLLALWCILGYLPVLYLAWRDPDASFGMSEHHDYSGEGFFIFCGPFAILGVVLSTLGDLPKKYRRKIQLKSQQRQNARERLERELRAAEHIRANELRQIEAEVDKILLGIHS